MIRLFARRTHDQPPPPALPPPPAPVERPTFTVTLPERAPFDIEVVRLRRRVDYAIRDAAKARLRFETFERTLHQLEAVTAELAPTPDPLETAA